MRHIHPTALTPLILITIPLGSILSQGYTNTITTTCPPGYYGKPAIYLYPQKDAQVSVKLDIDGEITKTIPPYNDGWDVPATVDGTITDENKGSNTTIFSGRLKLI